jgi:fatty-acyl-CoA synthase
LAGQRQQAGGSRAQNVIAAEGPPLVPHAAIRPGGAREAVQTSRVATALNMMAFLRANMVVPERPDRVGRALYAALPYGRSMLSPIAASAARYPRVPALVTSSEEVTYDQLWHGAAAVATGLADQGVTDASRIGVLCRNGTTFAYAMLGAVRLGADVILLNTGLGGEQLRDTVAAEDIDLVLHDDEFASLLVGHVIGAGDLRTMVAARPRVSVAPPRRQSNLIILTSGTTGRPKGATRASGGAAAEGASAVLRRIPLRARDTMVVSAPFFHAWGLSALLFGLALSATVVTDGEFDAAETLAAVEQRRARVLMVVPTMLQRICALPPERLAAANLDALEVIGSSGSALPGRLVTEVLDRFGPVLYNIYGSTEVSVATIATPSDLRSSPTTAGRAAPGVRVELVDANGHPVEAAATGRIFVGGPTRFDGYTGGGGKESVRGLLSTGDLGHFDASGLLFVDGREDDMIVSGGENVYPVEVEELLNRHRGVEEATVVGVADEEFGQALKAVIVAKAGSPVGADELKRFVAAHLARHKVPRVFEFVDTLPRTSTGKVLRRELAT